MTVNLSRRSRMPIALAVLIIAQLACAAFFLFDFLSDFSTEAFVYPMDTHLLLEAFAAVVLGVSVIVEFFVLRDLIRRKAQLETNLDLASAAVHDVINAHFEDWGLTPAEQDVATFLVKGLSTSEIAELRGTAEGTVKAHLHGIFRKSGTRNRTEVLSVLIDGLMAGRGQPS